MRQGVTSKAIESDRRGSFQRTTLWATEEGAETVDVVGAETGGERVGDDV